MGSGFKTFTAGAVLTASDVNNYLMEQSVMRFATTGARDTAITSPEDGMVAYIGSNDASEGLYTYNGTAWRKGPGWNAPWGLVASVINTAAATQTISGTSVLTSLTTGSIATLANRYYQVTMQFPATATGGNAVGQYFIARGASAAATTVAGSARTQIVMLAGSTIFTTQHSEVIVTTASAGIFYNAACQAIVNSPQVPVSTSTPSSLFVVDIGPAGAPS
jgi:hypothetical protein